MNNPIDLSTIKTLNGTQAFLFIEKNANNPDEIGRLMDAWAQARVDKLLSIYIRGDSTRPY